MKIPDPFPPSVYIDTDWQGSTHPGVAARPHSLDGEEALEVWRWRAAIAITAAIAGGDLSSGERLLDVAAIAEAGEKLADVLIDRLAKGRE